MNFIKTSFLLSFFCISLISFGQSVDDLVNKGIKFHDQGKYSEAIVEYEKALKIDPNSALVHYEMGLTYFEQKEYKKSIKHMDIVLKNKSKAYQTAAYITKGSSLDNLGRQEEAIKLFKKGIKKGEDHFLLHFNLGLTYYKMGDIENAEKSIINAIQRNTNHPTSHILLASINYDKGNMVETLLASHYFLLLEPDSKRSATAMEMLMDKFGGNVSKDPNKPNTINIAISGDTDSEFGAAELIVSMYAATKNLDENKDKSDDELFVENTESFFKFLGELKKKTHKGIWWENYIPFFNEVVENGHIETYCKYITQSSNENSKKWLEDNPDKLQAFGDWLKSRKDK